MPMSGNQKPGDNIKSFGDGAKVAMGSDPMPRPRGHMETTPMKMDLKDFSKTKSTACGVQYS